MGSFRSLHAYFYHLQLNFFLPLITSKKIGRCGNHGNLQDLSSLKSGFWYWKALDNDVLLTGNIWKKRLSLISFSFKPCAPFYKQQVSLKPMEQTLLLMVMRRLQNLSGRQNSQWCKCKDVEFLKLEPLATSQSCQTSFIRPSGRAGVASLPDSTSPVNTGWIIPMKGSSEAEKRDKLLIFLYYLLQCFSVCGG